MILHTSESRGNAFHGWLKSRHTFSFAEYYDPSRMGFGALRVINDDTVAAGMGFGAHPHRDMEIISIPLEGMLKHQDSENNSGMIKKGEVQIMSAGTGIRHSEFNASDSEEAKFLQIWVLPKKLGIRPRYEQRSFPHEQRKNRIQTIVSPDGRAGSLLINQDAHFALADLDQGISVRYQRQGKINGTGMGLYVFVIKGKVEVNGQPLRDRDGLGLESFDEADIKAIDQAEVLLMEVPV